MQGVSKMRVRVFSAVPCGSSQLSPFCLLGPVPAKELRSPNDNWEAYRGVKEIFSLFLLKLPDPPLPPPTTVQFILMHVDAMRREYN